MASFASDVWRRQQSLKATITSSFGVVLKVDWTFPEIVRTPHVENIGRPRSIKIPKLLEIRGVFKFF